MDDETKALEESAKAVQEVAKTTGKAIEASEKLGGFAAQFIRGPLEQVSGIIEDRLRYARWERRMRLVQRSKEYMTSLGINEATRKLPLNFAVPLLQAASLEENDELQDIWARLLVNAATDYQVEIRRAYISILEDFSSLEARIMDVVYTMPDLGSPNGFWTKYLPDRVETTKPEDKNLSPSMEVGLALDNLLRLNCLSSAMMWGGFTAVACVYPTPLGNGLYLACARRSSTH